MKRFIVIACILSIGLKSMAQKLEVGLMGGAMFYTGELVDNAMKSPKHFAGGMFLRVNMNHYVCLKGSILLGKVSGADSNSTNVYNKNRNLSFESKLSEFSAQVELNLIDNFKENGSRKPVVPYLFTGITIFHFNPQANLYDSASNSTTLYELQPLGTEGQGVTKYAQLKRYKLNSYSIPLGAGVKFHMGDNFTMGLEFGMRKCFTDYLDDVSGYYAENDLIAAQYGPTAAKLADRSQEVKGAENAKGTFRGNPQTQDWYGFGGLLISYSFIKKSRERCNQF